MDRVMIERWDGDKGVIWVNILVDEENAPKFSEIVSKIQ